MTAVVAIEKNNRYWLGADRQVTNGITKVDDARKITKFKDAYLGFTGSAFVSVEMEFFTKNLGADQKLNNLDNIYKFFCLFKAWLEERNYDTRDDSYGFIIINKNGIFTADKDESVKKINKNYNCAGSSKRMMNAIFEYVYPLHKSGKDVVKVMLKKAHENDILVGARTDIVSIKQG